MSCDCYQTVCSQLLDAGVHPEGASKVERRVELVHVCVGAAHEGVAEHMAAGVADTLALQDVAQPEPHGLHGEAGAHMQGPHEELSLQRIQKAYKTGGKEQKKSICNRNVPLLPCLRLA